MAESKYERSKSLTWNTDDHGESINKSQRFLQSGLVGKSKKRFSNSSENEHDHLSDADLRKLKFETGVPERIIRQALCVFDQFDHDRDGNIDINELHETLHAMGMKTNSKQIKRIMTTFDTNNDHQIDVEEFLVMEVGALLAAKHR